MNIMCSVCNDNDPNCVACHGHPYVTCAKAGCVLYLQAGYKEWKTGAQVLHETAKMGINLTEYASKAMPMSTYEQLLKAAEEQYTGVGVGPWQKDEMLDQMDLVFCDNMAEFLEIANNLPQDYRVLGQCIERLVKEVRDARNWPTPPRISEST